MNIFRTIFLLIAATASYPVYSQVEVEVLRQPVRVTAIYKVDPNSVADNCRKLNAEFRISLGDTVLNDGGEVWACKEPNERAIKNAVALFPPYLTFKFICTGSARACGERRLYAIADGKVVRLGSIDDYLLANGQTMFLKYFDWFEVNDLAGHSGGDFRVVIRHVGRKLVLDPELTWVLNHERYEASSLSPGGNDCGANRESANQPDCLANLLLSLTVAKVAGRNSYVNESLARSRRVLLPEKYEAISAMLGQVTPESIQRWLDRGQE